MVVARRGGGVPRGRARPPASLSRSDHRLQRCAPRGPHAPLPVPPPPHLRAPWYLAACCCSQERRHRLSHHTHTTQRSICPCWRPDTLVRNTTVLLRRRSVMTTPAHVRAVAEIIMSQSFAIIRCMVGKRLSPNGARRLDCCQMYVRVRSYCGTAHDIRDGSTQRLGGRLKPESTPYKVHQMQCAPVCTREDLYGHRRRALVTHARRVAVDGDDDEHLGFESCI